MDLPVRRPWILPRRRAQRDAKEIASSGFRFDVIAEAHELSATHAIRSLHRHLAAHCVLRRCRAENARGMIMILRG